MIEAAFVKMRPLSAEDMDDHTGKASFADKTASFTTSTPESPTEHNTVPSRGL
jgi:hypothetical protein